jgi:hypothetical protein
MEKLITTRKEVFRERQRFNDRLVYLLLSAGMIGVFYCFIIALMQGHISTEKGVLFLIVAIGLAGTIWWLKRLQLKVSVNKNRIKYKMKPFHEKAKKIAWNDIESCKIVRTPYAAQWHGGNVHFGQKFYYSLTGRNGLSIQTKDGRRLFIGCKDVDGLMQVLDRLSLSAQ